MNPRVAGTADLAVLALVSTGAAAAPASAGPAATLTVAADGSAQYRTVQAAINAAPVNSSARTTITIKAGTYREIVRVPSNRTGITLQGMGSTPAQTVLVFTSSASGSGTFNRACAEGTKYFLHLKARQHPHHPDRVEDNTHFQATGAIEVARLVATALRDRRALPPGSFRQLTGAVPPGAIVWPRTAA